MDGFNLKPEAFTFEFTAGTSAISTRINFQFNPELYVAIGDNIPIESEQEGFHVKPETFAFDFLVGADSGFHVKLEAFAFDLVIGERRTVLRLAIRNNGENVLVPFTTKIQAPAFVVRWDGLDWYNPLVSPNDSKASAIPVKYNGEIFALST